MSNQELEVDINERNFEFKDSNCTVVHSYKMKNSKQSAIIEVPSELYTYIVNNNYYIYVGHEKCKAYDEFNLNPCLQCGGFGHSTKKCINTRVCLKCSKNHEQTKCTNKEFCCINCINSNIKLKTKYDTQHKITDTKNCKILKSKILNIIESTEYPRKPKIPLYISLILEEKEKKKKNKNNNNTLNE